MRWLAAFPASTITIDPNHIQAAHYYTHINAVAELLRELATKWDAYVAAVETGDSHTNLIASRSLWLVVWQRTNEAGVRCIFRKGPGPSGYAVLSPSTCSHTIYPDQVNTTEAGRPHSVLLSAHISAASRRAHPSPNSSSREVFRGLPNLNLESRDRAFPIQSFNCPRHPHLSLRLRPRGHVADSQPTCLHGQHKSILWHAVSVGKLFRFLFRLKSLNADRCRSPEVTRLDGRDPLVPGGTVIYAMVLIMCCMSACINIPERVTCCGPLPR